MNNESMYFLLNMGIFQPVMLLVREFFQKHLKRHISAEQLTVVKLLLLGDEILASHIGIMINHYKDP